MLSNAHKPVVGFAAYSGGGKTTLLKAMIPLFRAQGLRVAVIKPTHHDFDIDIPGKDSHELRKAGAAQILIASARREALITEKDIEDEPDLNELLGRLDQDNLDIILVEGFKHVPFPKIEVYRGDTGRPPLYPDDRTIIAVVTDSELPVATDLPVLDINNPETVVGFVCQHCR